MQEISTKYRTCTANLWETNWFCISCKPDSFQRVEQISSLLFMLKSGIFINPVKCPARAGVQTVHITDEYMPLHGRINILSQLLLQFGSILPSSNQTKPTSNIADSTDLLEFLLCMVSKLRLMKSYWLWKAKRKLAVALDQGTVGAKHRGRESWQLIPFHSILGGWGWGLGVQNLFSL